jgi:hypothetical protein
MLIAEFAVIFSPSLPRLLMYDLSDMQPDLTT